MKRSIQACPLVRYAAGLMATVLWVLHPSAGPCDLYVEFLVDRSESMGAMVGDKSKVQIISEAVDAISLETPGEVAIGLRIYPPPKGLLDREDPGLRIPVAKENRGLLPAELARLTPRGNAPLAEHLKKALTDFPEKGESKLLVWITDGSGTLEESFCKDVLLADPPSGLRFQAYSLGVSDPNELKELNCLSNLLSGTTVNLKDGDSLQEALSPVIRKAYEEEAARIARVEEERRVREALRNTARLTVAFHNELDPFFADSVEILSCRLDGKDMPVEGNPLVAKDEKRTLLNEPMPPGKYRLEVQYAIRKGGDSIQARPGAMEVGLEDGKTTLVSACPRAAFFSWGMDFRTSSE